MKNEIENKLNLLADESLHLRKKQIAKDLEMLLADYQQPEQEIISNTIQLLMKTEIKNLTEKADILQQENKEAVEQLKQIADAKARTKRPRVETERINNIIVRKSK